MALAKCPESECGRMISDQAEFCPGCGCPIDRNNRAPTPQPTGGNAITEMERLIRDLQQSPVDPIGAQRVADRIAQIKSASFESMDAFIKASAEAGSLILSDGDVGLLGTMTDEQSKQISRVYAISCGNLQDDHAHAIWGFRNLDLLDLSYCPNISDMLFSALRSERLKPGPTMLKGVYLRACRRVSYVGVGTLARYCPYFSSLHIDGNPQIHTGAIIIFGHVPGLQVLSVAGCPQLDVPEFRKLARMKAPSCKIVGRNS